MIRKNLDSRGLMFCDELETIFPVASTSIICNAIPVSPFIRFREVSFLSVSRSWIVQNFPFTSGSALMSKTLDGHPVINDPSHLLSPVPDPGSILVRNGIRHPHPNLVENMFETSEEVVRL